MTFEVLISKCSEGCVEDVGQQAAFFRDKRFSIYVTSNQLLANNDEHSIVPFTKLTNQFSLSHLQNPQQSWVTI